MCLNIHFKGTIPALLWADNEIEVSFLTSSLPFCPLPLVSKPTLEPPPSGTGFRGWAYFFACLKICIPTDRMGKQVHHGRQGFSTSYQLR